METWFIDAQSITSQVEIELLLTDVFSTFIDEPKDTISTTTGLADGYDFCGPRSIQVTNLTSGTPIVLDITSTTSPINYIN